jgi:tetratricopeptide (TPR) repeat protein
MKSRAAHWVAPALTVAALLAGSPAFAIPDATGQIPTPAAAPEGAMAARLAYNVGLEQFEKTRAAEQAGVKGKAQAKLLDQYREARIKFDEAAVADPTLKEAWNLIGYTSRRLGEYDRSLAAYEKALALNPEYSEAIEYRAEAYLALNRIDDAKAAYLTLFGTSRTTANVLLQSMQQWVVERRKQPGTVTKEQLDAFAQWVGERASLAQQTAAVTDATRAGATQALRDWR